MKVFNLPDLGEGLPDAEIVQWHVKVGDTVKTDQILVEVQTAKAIVEIPSPYDGEIAILHGNASDIIETGSPLITFKDADNNQSAEPAKTVRRGAPAVGAMDTSDAIIAETKVSSDGISISPEVKALARKLKVDLQSITTKNNVITLADVQAAAASATSGQNASTSTNSTNKLSPRARANTAEAADDHRSADVSINKHYEYPKRTQTPSGQAEQLKGDRRAMAQSMAKVRDKVMHTTLFDSANINSWPKKTDITARIIRAMVAASMVEPNLNAWFDDEKLTRTLHPHINIGIAVDSAAGLTVPVLKNAEQKTPIEMRAELKRLIDAVSSRTIRQDDLTGATITLSNFGMIAGKFATPIISPPEVAILAIGRITQELELTEQGIQKVRHLPISLSFDHRAVTGGDACRFLAAVLSDLALPY